MTNEFTFEGSPVAGKDSIIPAITMVPEWYKKTPRWVGDEKTGNPGLKMCVPFLDAMSTGYLMLLTQDLYVEQTEDGPSIRYKIEPSPVGSRPPGSTDPMPAPAGYDDEHFIWHTQSAFFVPEGYSAVCTHPFNRFDLPFITLTGVVDGEFYMHGGNVPFHIKKGFEGVIPSGTPIMQIVPFKRDEWKAKERKGVWNKALMNTVTEDYAKGAWYRRRKWKKKSFK